MNSTVALFLLQDGIVNGAVYALLSLAIILVFSVTRIIFLPQGEFVSFAALTFVFMQDGRLPGTVPFLGVLVVIVAGLEIANGIKSRDLYGAGRTCLRLCILPAAIAIIAVATAGTKLPLLVQAALAIAVVSASAPLLYRIVYQPIADASVLVLLIVSVALHFVLVGFGLYFFGPEGSRSAPLATGAFDLWGVPVSGQTLVIIAATFALIGALYWGSRHSYYGKAMLAVAINRRGARLMGISAPLAGRVCFLLAALIGSISGVLIAPVVTIYYDTGFLLGLKGFVGAIIGGFGSYPAAAVGSLLVGLLESYSSFFASAFKEVIVFTLIIPALMIRSLMSDETEGEHEETETTDDTLQTDDEKQTGWVRYTAIGIVAAALIGAPILLSDYQIALLNYTGLASLVALGLVLLTGVAGLTSFGQAAFVGLGAYATGYLTGTSGLSPWLTLPLALFFVLVVSFFTSAVTVRLSGHYLSLCTLAIGVSFYFLFGSLQITGGQSGMSEIPSLSLFEYDLKAPKAFYWLIWSTVILSSLALHNLLDSRPGRAIRALKRGSGMAEAMGVDTHKAKMTSFIIACLLAGVSGWLYAHFLRFVNPSPFSLNQSIEYLFMAVIGGVGTLGGAFLGSGLVVFMKEWLQDILPKVLGTTGNFEIIVFGIVTILMLQYAPGGLWPRIARLLNLRSDRAVLSSDIAEPLPRRARPALGQKLLSLRNVCKSFDGLQANRDLSFDVAAGSIVALIGPNGAGKTTLFNLISRTLAPSAGTIEFLGSSTASRSTRDLALHGLSRTFQHVKLVPEMSVLENAALGTHGRGNTTVASAAVRLDRAQEQRLLAEANSQLKRVGLGHLAHKSAGSLALGQQRILEIARALAADPCLLLLDEPAAGLRLLEKEALKELLLKLKDDGMGILLVEHDMDFVMNLADRVVVMNFGEKLAEGTPDDIRRNPAVVEAYLGGEA